jgi:hypothetical protein
MLVDDWLLPRWPIERHHARKDERHSDFRFDVWQKVGNPPGCAGLPVNERRIARREISVEPQGYAQQLDDPTNNDCLAQTPARLLRSCKPPSKGALIFFCKRDRLRRSRQNPMRKFDQATAMSAAPFRLPHQPTPPPRPASLDSRMKSRGRTKMPFPVQKRRSSSLLVSKRPKAIKRGSGSRQWSKRGRSTTRHFRGAR